MATDSVPLIVARGGRPTAPIEVSPGLRVMNLGLFACLLVCVPSLLHFVGALLRLDALLVWPRLLTLPVFLILCLQHVGARVLCVVA